jgi:hypothetical protein
MRGFCSLRVLPGCSRPVRCPSFWVSISGLGIDESSNWLASYAHPCGGHRNFLVPDNRADRIGRRRMLIIGSVLMLGAGIVFASTSDFLVLLLAGTTGVISRSGKRSRAVLVSRAGRAFASSFRPLTNPCFRLVHSGWRVYYRPRITLRWVPSTDIAKNRYSGR